MSKRDFYFETEGVYHKALPIGNLHQVDRRLYMLTMMTKFY